MLLEEALVIFACINSTGCKETSTQYYSTHPEVKQMIERQERKVKEFVGPYLVEAIGPVLFVAVGGTGTVRLYKNWSLQISEETSMLSFRKDF